jgi:putative transposase
MHAIWTLPEGDQAFGQRWGAIKARFTRAVRAKSSEVVGWNPTLRREGSDKSRVGFHPTRSPSKLRKGDGGIWQRRFWEHHIRDEADYRAHVAYCWGNPVKHGLVARAVAWPFSSLHRDIRLGCADPDWAGAVPEGAFGE